MKVYQLRYIGPESFYGPKKGFILTVQSEYSNHPTWPEIKKALEAVGFKNVSSSWGQLNCWE